MECCITLTTEPDRVVIRLAGHLRGAQVPDLLRICRDNAVGTVSLDLSDLLNADSMGLDALRKLRGQGVSFDGLSEYLRLKLNWRE